MRKQSKYETTVPRSTFLDGTCQWDRGRCPRPASNRWGLCYDHLAALAASLHVTVATLEPARA